MSGPEPAAPDNRGRILFFVLLIGIGCILLWYAAGTQSMGIEERFSSALGIAHEDDEHGHEEGGGFALEGSMLLYAIVLVLFAGVCWIVYRKYGM